MSPTNRSPTNNSKLIVAMTMTHVVDSPPCQPIISSDVCWRDATWRNALPTHTVDSTHCRRSADADRRYDRPTQCRHRPSIRPTDATHCQHDPVPTRTVAVRCDALPTKKLIKDYLSKSTRWTADEVSRSPRCRTVDEWYSHTCDFTPQLTDRFETSRTSYEQIL